MSKKRKKNTTQDMQLHIKLGVKKMSELESSLVWGLPYCLVPHLSVS